MGHFGTFTTPYHGKFPSLNNVVFQLYFNLISIMFWVRSAPTFTLSVIRPFVIPTQPSVSSIRMSHPLLMDLVGMGL